MYIHSCNVTILNAYIATNIILYIYTMLANHVHYLYTHSPVATLVKWNGNLVVWTETRHQNSVHNFASETSHESSRHILWCTYAGRHWSQETDDRSWCTTGFGWQLAFIHSGPYPLSFQIPFEVKVIRVMFMKPKKLSLKFPSSRVIQFQLLVKFSIYPNTTD